MEGLGPLGSRVQGVKAEQVSVSGGRVALGGGISVPLEPMIGCVGVAPADGVASAMRPVYPTGGNLDLRDLSVGAVVSLPVQAPGALLSIGDLHAAMGQGEPAFVALEASGTATVRVELDRDSPLKLPRLRVGDETVCVGMGNSFPEARHSAVERAFELLTETHGLAPTTAYAYLCARVSLRAAGPSGSMANALDAVLAAVPDPR
jgi:amidase